MLDLVKSSVRPLMLDMAVLEVAYELYSQAPQAALPAIDLRELSQRTGKSLLVCRNAIVEGNQTRRFPDCRLIS